MICNKSKKFFLEHRPDKIVQMQWLEMIDLCEVNTQLT